MATAIDNLWPADIAATEGAEAPIAILKQQASLLGQTTKNLVEAIVETKATDYARHMEHWFVLVAPALNFYRYPLFSVRHHAVKMYPVTIVDQSMFEKQADGASQEITANDESQFKEMLRNIFAHKETKSIVGALVAQSTASSFVALP